MSVVQATEAEASDLFEQSMVTLSEVFGRELTPLVLEAYRAALAYVPTEVLLLAIPRALQVYEMMPRPAQLLATCREQMSAAELALYDDVLKTRSVLKAGVIPSNWTPRKYIAISLALGLGAPDQGRVDALVAMRRHSKLEEDPPLDPDDAGMLELFLVHGVPPRVGG